ncbi:hypothetical protein nbrc107696_16540 [Gordonia spumicola]|uniref:VOC domain-containing protein n=1 Tax=Gordonia spumicola TaxID=589161 RepID=A0A7I9V754_9ACTN|nr:VOC family protein [Gordonia spumicola]GEE01208.1 hypothetical protein nbrc107696_16540 [Gordonia spumicola]
MPAHTPASTAPIWFDLASSDPGRAADFYTTLFGWTADEPSAEFGGYQNFRRDGALVAGLGPAQDGGPADVWTVYFRSDDIPATLEAAEAAGGTVIASAMQIGDLGSMAVLADPAGGAFGLWQPGTHAGFSTMGEPGAPYWFDEMSMDYDASKAFYETTFGWTLTEIGEGTEGGPGQYSQVLIGGEAQAGIMAAAGMLGEGHPSFWQVYITVDDVPTTLDRVVELGGAVLMPADDTPFGVLASFKDPLGSAICIASVPEGM